MKLLQWADSNVQFRPDLEKQVFYLYYPPAIDSCITSVGLNQSFYSDLIACSWLVLGGQQSNSRACKPKVQLPPRPRINAPLGRICLLRTSMAWLETTTTWLCSSDLQSWAVMSSERTSLPLWNLLGCHCIYQRAGQVPSAPVSGREQRQPQISVKSLNTSQLQKNSTVAICPEGPPC